MTFASRSRVLYLALRRFNHSNNKPAAYIYVFSTFWAFCNGEKKKKKINNFPPQKTRSNPIGNIFVGNIFHEREKEDWSEIRFSPYDTRKREHERKEERKEGKNGMELELWALIFHNQNNNNTEKTIDARNKHGAARVHTGRKIWSNNPASAIG